MVSDSTSVDMNVVVPLCVMCFLSAQLLPSVMPWVVSLSKSVLMHKVSLVDRLLDHLRAYTVTHLNCRGANPTHAQPQPADQHTLWRPHP